MYILIKTVHGNKYWYNQWTKKWEGLKDNVTVMTEKDFTEVWASFSEEEKQQITFHNIR